MTADEFGATGDDIRGAVDKTAQGASAFGPWGALVAGVIGLGEGIYDVASAKKGSKPKEKPTAAPYQPPPSRHPIAEAKAIEERTGRSTTDRGTGSIPSWAIPVAMGAVLLLILRK